MSLSIANLVKSIIQKYIFYPLIVFSITTGLVFLSLVVWLEKYQNSKIIEGNNDIIYQYILSGDSSALKRHVKSMASIAGWSSVSVFHQNNLEMASFGDPDDCSSFFVIKNIEGMNYGKLCYQKSFFSKKFEVVFAIFFLLIGVFVTIIFALNKAKNLLQIVSLSFEKLANEISENKEIVRNDNLSIEELRIIQSFNLSLKREEAYRNDLIKAEKDTAIGKVAMQVSHDIRSPLAALNMIISSTDPQSESDRVIMRGAVQRINDIANQLLNKGKASTVEQGTQENKCEVELLSTLIDSIVSEKRIQFREKQNIEIESRLNDGYGLFSSVNATELLRTISNTLNNAIEALPNSTGKIIVSLSEVDSFNVIKISDNGKGIPKHILEKLGQMGVSHGKVGSESGSGLGVYHAKKTIESFGGIFEVESVENKGTTILIKLPKADNPAWFVKYIQVPQIVVALDDDLSIHQIWKERFKNQNIELISFTSATVFKEWMSKNSYSEVLFLIDYELLNQNDNGLDLIKEFHIATQSILVTSRYDEFIIKEEAQTLGLRLLPKSAASIVPLVFDQRRTVSDKKKEFFDCILIDDDQLIRLIWERAALKKNKSFLAFSHPDDFFKEIHRFDLDSCLYFDSELGNEIKGEEVSKRAYFEFGFKNIYLCTGHSPDHFTNVAHLKKVIGKDPEF